MGQVGQPTALTRGPATSSVLAVFVVATFAVADLQIERIGWSSENLGPTSRSIAIGAVWSTALVATWAYSTVASRRPITLGIRLLFAFLAWSLLTSAIGIDPNRSVIVWMGFAALASCVVAVTRVHGPFPIVAAIFIACAAISTASVAADQVSSDLRLIGRLSGYAFEPNVLGQLAGLGLVCGAILVATRRMSAMWFLAAMAPLVMAAWLTGTRTTWPALAVAALVAFHSKQRRMVLATTGFVVALAIFFVGVEPLTGQVQRSEIEDLSRLSGRVELWKWSFAETADRPLTGFGLGSADEQFAAAKTAGLVRVESFSSHNLLLETARETGIVGLGLLLAAIAATRPWRARAARPLAAFLAVSALTMPTSGLPGLVYVAWLALICWDHEPDSLPYS